MTWTSAPPPSSDFSGPREFVSSAQLQSCPSCGRQARRTPISTRTGVSCTATGDSSTLVLGLDLKNFDCLLGDCGSPLLLAVSIAHRVVVDLGLLSRASCLGIISVMFTGSVVLVVLDAAAGCLTFSSVCLSACHALRDLLMALHELLVGELFACVQHAHSRAARGSRQSSQPAVARAWSSAFALAVCHPRNLLDDICACGDWSFLKLLAEGSRADRLENDSLSARTMLLSECVTISDQGHCLRLIHVGLRVSPDLCLAGSSGFE